MNAIFRPHGKFQVWTEGQLLLTELTGPWNRELVEYWAAQAFELASTFSVERPYIGITIVHDSILCPADAIDRIAQAVQVSQTKLHCIENVIVAADSVEGKDLVKSTYQRMGLRHFFSDLDSAKAWAEHTMTNHVIKTT
ncbi:hypothetical protein [Undibacterium sp.]|uniref:hypothetical protein n=1 Tax=Undibacterium sp. TaxID=1914977 RepID=UPI003752B252